MNKSDKFKTLEKLLLVHSDVAISLMDYISELADNEETYYVTAAKKAVFNADFSDNAKVSYGKKQAFEYMLTLLSSIKH